MSDILETANVPETTALVDGPSGGIRDACPHEVVERKL